MRREKKAVCPYKAHLPCPPLDKPRLYRSNISLAFFLSAMCIIVAKVFSIWKRLLVMGMMEGQKQGKEGDRSHFINYIDIWVARTFWTLTQNKLDHPNGFFCPFLGLYSSHFQAAPHLRVSVYSSVLITQNGTFYSEITCKNELHPFSCSNRHYVF